MNIGSDTCNAPSAEHEGAYCQREPGHIGPHLTTVNHSSGEVFSEQFTKVARPQNDVDDGSPVDVWTHILPPLGTQVCVETGGKFSYDGALEGVTFSEGAPTALLIVGSDLRVVVRWGAVMSIDWPVEP